jgi:hypothetical protein
MKALDGVKACMETVHIDVRAHIVRMADWNRLMSLEI